MGLSRTEQYEALIPRTSRLSPASACAWIFTGMRLGEVLTLQWAQVDFLSGDDYAPCADETKNGEGRASRSCLSLALLDGTARRAACKLSVRLLPFDRRGNAVKLEDSGRHGKAPVLEPAWEKMEP